MTLVPDLAAPVVGWRVWNVIDRGRGPELVSPIRPLLWRHRVATTAICSSGCGQCPSSECRCGLYAASRCNVLPVGYRGGPTVLGCTALWGRAVEHTDGFRGQHGYPLVLIVTSGSPVTAPSAMRRRFRHPLRIPMTDDDLVRPQDARGQDVLCRRLAQLYGVPVHPVPSMPSTWAGGWVRAGDREADAVRSEAVDGLTARRSGDPEAGDRLTRRVQDLLDSAG